MKKILLIVPTSNQVLTFRKCLIEALQNNKYLVSVLAFDNNSINEIKRLNIDFYYVKNDNRSTNPFKIMLLKNRFEKVIKKIMPDIVFTFMLKPNIFGVLAAHNVGVKNIFSMVEGTGDPFTYKTLKWKFIKCIVTFLYRNSFKYSKNVFFLNNDDKKEFITLKIVKEDQCKMIFGIGVDLSYFSFKPIKNNSTFLMIARMLETKGVYEYCKAAREIKKRYPKAVFNYLGPEGTIKIKDIEEYILDGSINYLGTTDDVRPYIEECTFFVLPSYKEGMPVAVMEAQAMGRPTIVSDTNGCRDTVVDGINGFIICARDYYSLREKFSNILDNNHNINQLSIASRIFAEERFDCREINNQIIEEINNS